MQLDAGLVVGAGLAVALHTHVASGDALYRAVLVVEHLGRGEAGIDLDPQGFGLLAQPAHHIAQADNEVAVVVHLRRGGQLVGFFGGQEQEAVRVHRGVQRRAALPPVGEQFFQRARLDDGAGQDVGTHLGALLHDAH